MVMSVVATSGAITAAINAFDAGYHADYFKVRSLARAYLASPPSPITSMPLASTLSEVLPRWGAGRRGAPTCQSLAAMGTALNNTSLHLQLNNLQRSIPFLNISAGSRSLSAGAPFAAVADFDRCLVDTLSALSTGLFDGNTNVTYPMKSLLLLTSLMPAFDSQVRGGLTHAGVSGVKKTRYLLPKLGSSDAQKICALPFYVADCSSRNSAVLNREVSGSSYPALATEHGRIFDVLLFMQNGGAHPTVSFTPPALTRWYAI